MNSNYRAVPPKINFTVFYSKTLQISPSSPKIQFNKVYINIEVA